jgi:branched-chain amino acid transport system substrate-binding protein
VQAQFMQEQGVKSVYILNDKEAYGLGVAKNLKGAAEALGIKVLGFSAYDPKQPNYQALFTHIKSTNPDAIFVGGLIDENSGQLINDKVSVLGPNTKVKLFLPDGFTTDAIFDRKEGGTPNAKGAFFSVAGVGIDQYTGKAKDFIDGFKSDVLKGKPVDPYAILAVQAADVMLTAIANSDGSRSGVIDQVFKTQVNNGYIGSFKFNQNGDLASATGASLTFTIYKGTNHLETLKTMNPKTDLVEAARKAAAG